MKSFLVVGTGRFGVNCIKGLLEKKQTVIIVDPDEEKLYNLAETLKGKVECILADPLQLEKLKEGLENYKVSWAIVCSEEDFGETVRICKNLEKAGIEKIIAIEPETDEEAEALTDVGVTKLISLDKEAAKQVVDTLCQPPAVIKHVEIEDINIDEIIIPPELAGKKLRQLKLRERYNVVVLRIGRKENDHIHTHRPLFDEVIKVDDTLFVEGDKKNIERLAKNFSRNKEKET